MKKEQVIEKEREAKGNKKEKNKGKQKIRKIREREINN
jgi:hypothetical protein